jgi:drug/metabolite transporter (DMT)-like permease
LFLAVLCSFFYGASSVLCKHGLQEDRRGVVFSSVGVIARFLLRNRMWILGVGLSSVANVLLIQAQAGLDVSVVYPILNFAYVFTLLLGGLMLREVLDRSQWLGIGVVSFGTVLVLLVPRHASGGAPDPVALPAVAGIALLLIGFFGWRAYRGHERNYEATFAICAGIAFAEVAAFLKTDTHMVTQHVGHFSIFSLDSIVEFFTIWPSLALFAFSGIGFLCMHIAYSHGNVSLTVPLIAVSQRIMEAPIGLFVFGEEFAPIKIAGLFFIVSGGLLLVRSLYRPAPDGAASLPAAPLVDPALTPPPGGTMAIAIPS